MRALAAALAAVVLVGCSETPKPVAEKKKEEKPEPLTGRAAFYKMYPSARTWASDAVPIELKSLQLDQVKAENGEAGAWQCIFVSPSRGRQKAITWSAVEADGNLHKGVFAGQEETYTASRLRSTYLTAAIKHDSDEALKAATAKGDPYFKKPSPLVNFLLEQTPRYPNLAWRIFWGGDSASTAEFSVFVDATTGEFLGKAR